ncbi:bifunctional DNA-binding transcriptional regulator/O6-methylguanine-DNA methyltransferase Ada [Thalassobaculum sp.]|uniref:bifunctional DNA-binding transcriptional regulator/O6-methylguanine-DNA methyltransferase Ada n=1 Tax=Thalassobaculum sp. TaxID=2022740 RepID=UPI003B593DC7
MTVQMTASPAKARTPMDDDARYRVVVARDKSFDGAFIVAVRTTGVYCRPYCPSRTPKRENVSFFQTPEQARSAGYRACRRCKPDESAAPDPRLDAVRAACRAIESAEDECPSLEALGTAAGLSPFHLQRSFKAVMGISPRQYWDARRLGKLKENLKSGEGVAMALYGAGYGSSSRLYEKAGAQLGMTPASYGKGGAGAVIAYAFADTSLGRVIVGATKTGICFVGIGDTDEALVEELRGDFPNATLAADPGGLGETLGEVAGMLEGREPHVDLPLDIRGTAFQRQVWQALTDIPMGETRTYADLAAAIGRPKAIRAVGSACANNPVSLIVPCHRAIGTDGTLRGYRWGLDRKRRLIDTEVREAERASAK